jgi:hypothetical protein
MKNLATKSFIVLLGLISLVLMGTIAFGAYYIKNKSIRTAETVQKVEESSNNSLLVQSINSSGDNTSNELTKLEGLGLSQEKLVGFIENLEELARSMNLSIKIVSVDSEPGKGADNPDKIHFKIETFGNWSSNMKFLHALEYLSYRIMIGNTELSSKGTNNLNIATTSISQKNNWKLNTDLSVYSFK